MHNFGDLINKRLFSSFLLTDDSNHTRSRTWDLSYTLITHANTANKKTLTECKSKHFTFERVRDMISFLSSCFSNDSFLPPFFNNQVHFTIYPNFIVGGIKVDTHKVKLNFRSIYEMRAQSLDQLYRSDSDQHRWHTCQADGWKLIFASLCTFLLFWSEMFLKCGTLRHDHIYETCAIGPPLLCKPHTHIFTRRHTKIRQNRRHILFPYLPKQPSLSEYMDES